MVNVSIDGDLVRFRVQGIDKLWAFNPEGTVEMLKSAIDAGRLGRMKESV